MRKFKVTLFFAWHDFWIGFFWNRRKRLLYLLPVPMLGFRIDFRPMWDLVMHCPECSYFHLDEGEWLERRHKTHQCQNCGHEWRPYDYPTRGVLPGQLTCRFNHAALHRKYFGNCPGCIYIDYNFTPFPGEIEEMKKLPLSDPRNAEQHGCRCAEIKN